MLRRRLPEMLVIALAACACWMLHLAAPQGILWADTAGYFLQGRYLSDVWTPNNQDWRHLPLFSLLLRAAAIFPNPPAFILAFNAALFTLILLLVRSLGQEMTGSRWAGFGLAAGVLLAELLLLNTFFFLAHLIADTPFSLLLLAGSLTAILGFWRRSLRLSVAGYALLGAALFTKPAGMAVVPMWLCIAAWTAYDRTGSRMRRTGAAILLVTLLSGPMVLWSARNALLYGHFRPNAYLSRNIMARTLPMVRDDDVILDDAADNAAFLATIRTFEAVNGRTYNDYMSFGVVNGVDSGMHFLARYVPGSGVDDASGYPFAFDPFAVGIALRIIRQHPLEYVRLSCAYYIRLFSPWVMNYVTPSSMYIARYPAPKEFIVPGIMEMLYPPFGIPDPPAPNPYAQRLLESSDPLRALAGRRPLRLAFFLLAHALAAGALALLFRQGAGAMRNRRRPALLALVTLALFGNAAFLYLLHALVEQPLERYQLMGSMGLDILYVTWAGTMCVWVLRRFARTPR